MKRLFKRLGIIIEHKHLLVLVVSLALIIPSIFGAMQLEMKTGNETFVSTDSQVYKDFDKFNQHFSGDVVIILLTGDNRTQLLQPGSVAAMDILETKMGENPRVVSAIGPAFLIKQAFAQQTGFLELPDNLAQIEAIVVDSENGQIRPQFQQVFPDNEHAFIAVTLEGNLSPDEQKSVVKEIRDTIDEAGFDGGIVTTVTGIPVVLNVMTDSLGSSMRNMLLLSIGIMLLVLVMIFSVRGFFAWRWLPLGVVLIAIIYAFGAMGILSIPITMVTIAAFPILIGLGVDYAIQFHNRYDEEARRGETVAEAIIDSVTHIGPTIGIAIIAACLGFAALFFSPVPMIRDFGLTLIIGVVAAYLLSLFALLAILYWHDRRAGAKAKSGNKKMKPEKERMHLVDRILYQIAPWVIRNPAIVIPVALVLCVGGIIADFQIKTETDQMKYLSQDIPAIQDLQTAESVLGGVSSTNIFIEAEDVTDPAILSWMVQLEQDINKEQSGVIGGSTSIADLVMQANGGTMPQDPQAIGAILEAMPAQFKSNFVTDNHTEANMIIRLKEMPSDQMKELNLKLVDIAKADPPDGVEVTVTGTSVFMIELFSALTSGRLEMTLIGIALVFAGLFLLFKFNLVRALIAILPIGLILGWSGGTMYLLGIKYTPVTATLGALIIGIGVEFTILLMMRYYEERDKGQGAVEAMIIAITRIGRAVIASGFTVIGGFGALLIARDFPIIQDFGVVTLINVFFALISTLFVLPVLIVFVDRRLSNLSRRRR